MNRFRHWLVLLAGVSAFAGAVAACGGDDSEGSQPDSGVIPDAGVDHARDVQADVDSGSSSEAGPEGGPDAGDAGVDACGVPADPDSSPKVRFINALFATPSYPVVAGEVPAIRLYANGSPVAGLSDVSSGKGADSVSKYAKITAGDTTFSVRTPAADGGTDTIVTADILSVAAGARLTLIAMGRPGSLDIDAPKLLVLQEKFTTIDCGEAALRFVSADTNATAATPQFYIDQATTAAATPAWGTASDEAGIVVPLTTKSIALKTTPAILFGPTGQAPFSLPPTLLGRGRPYFVIELGEPARPTDDDRSHRLLFVPAGDDTPATLVKRDPLVYFFHASPPSTPANLSIYSGTDRLAINLKFGTQATYADLKAEGATLSFVDPAGVPDGGAPDAGDGGVIGTTVLDNQATGTLDPGGLYLGVLMGLAGEAAPNQLQAKFWKVEPTVLNAPLASPKVMVINASPNAGGLDFGYWSPGDAFTSSVTNLGYGNATAAAGVDFAAPTYDSTNQKVGVQSTGSPSTNRSALGPLAVGWYAAVLAGDWSSSASTSSSRLIFLSNFGLRLILNPKYSLPAPPP